MKNSVAERINGVLKQGYLGHHPVRFLNEAHHYLEQTAFLYYHERLHLSCSR